MADGFHYARWIVPLVCVFFALACFMPLALTVNPLFWIGTGSLTVIGGVLGAVFHIMASRISPSQVALRKRCILLGQRLVGLQNLLGLAETLSPKVAEILDEAARVYLIVRPATEKDAARAASGVWSEATQKALLAMDDAMAQMLRLAEPETPQAQEIELARGWAQPLLEEMKSTAIALTKPSRTAQLAAQMESSSLAGLADARANLERLESAVAELEREQLHER